MEDGWPRVGVTEFTRSGYPHLKESYWFGEGVLPLLERRGLWRIRLRPLPGPGLPGAEQVSTPFAPARTEPTASEKAAAP
jgi:alkanesulfonate monooxygenase